MDERLQIFQDKMEKSLANLNEEFAGIRAGRANPHVLDNLRVDYYGTPSPKKPFSVRIWELTRRMTEN